LKKLVSMRKIFLDVDGVIIDSIAISLRCIESIQGKPYHTYDASKVLTWDMHDVVVRSKDDPLSDNEFMNGIFDSNLFWEFADDYIFRGVKEFVEKYHDRIVFCTIGSINNISNKSKWLQKHFGEVDILPVITDMSIHPKRINKSYIRMDEGDIFIEDSLYNLECSEAGGKILFNSYGNFHAEWSIADGYCIDPKATNWNQIDDIVKVMISRFEEEAYRYGESLY
jgi:5'(3')-deoxyribonucleotidase